MPTIPLTGTPGFRFDWQLWPSARAGGLSYYAAFTEVKSGLVASWAKPAAAGPLSAPGTQTIAVTAGQAYIDAEICVLSAGANVTVNPALSIYTPVANGFNDYVLYLNPTRNLQAVPLGTAAPTTYLNGAAIKKGARYAKCIDHGDYLGAKEYYNYNGAAWEKFDPTFESPKASAQQGRNRAWGNDILPALAASNFSINALEKEIYAENAYPPYTNSNSKGQIRKSASLEVGKLSLYYYVLPLSIVVSSNAGSPNHTVDDATAAVLADIVAAAGSVANLSVKVVSEDTGYFATTGASSNVTAISGNTITTTNNAVGANLAASLVIQPQTPGEIYLLDRNKSELVDIYGVAL